MKQESNFSNVIIVIIVIILILSIVYLPKIIKKDYGNVNSDKYFEEIKNYGVNEYIPTMVDDEQMSRKYLNDFKNALVNDLDASYNLLDHDYRNEIFGSVSEYKKYLSSLDLTRMTELDKWATYDKNGYKYYDLYDKNGNRFIFKTKGVMQYEVLFEDYDINGKNGE